MCYIIWKRLQFYLYRKLIMAALWNRAGHYNFALWFLLLSIYLSIFFSPNLSRSETCCMGFGESRQKIAIWAPSHKFVGLYLRKIRQVSTIGKKLLSSNIFSTCPHNMVNLGPLSAEIVSLVWGTPANYGRPM